MMDPLSMGAMSFISGGAIGAIMGYALKKLFKIIIIGLGLIFVLIAYLQYKGWISVNWPTVQHDVSVGGQQAAQNALNMVNNTAQHVAAHGLNTADILYPVAGVMGFIPGFWLGFVKG